MNHIFVSYSRSNEDIVSEIVDALRKRNLDIWQDISGKLAGIPYSTKWFDAIEWAICSAKGAVIFQSNAWLASSPCSKEMQLIKDTQTPYLVIDATSSNIDVNAAVDKIREWAAEKTDTHENIERTGLVSKAYRYDQGEAIDSIIPRTRNLKDAREAVSVLQRHKTVAGTFSYNAKTTASKDSLCTRYVTSFVKAEKKTLLKRTAIILLGILVAAAALAVIVVTIPLIKSYYDEAYKIETIGSNTKTLEMLLETDPISALKAQALSENLETYEEESYKAYSMKAMETLTKHFPKEYYLSGTGSTAHYANSSQLRQTDLYSVSISTSTGTVKAVNRMTGGEQTIAVDGIPSSCTLSDEGNWLVIGSEKKAYLVNLGGSAEPEELIGLNEPIENVGFSGEDIFAVTSSGAVAVWDNPLQAIQSSDYSLSAAVLGNHAGTARAIFVNGNNAYVEDNSDVLCCEVPSRTELKQGVLALSADCNLCAFVGTKDEEDSVLVFDANTGQLLQDFVSDYSFSAITFDNEGKILAGISSEDNRIASFSLVNEHSSTVQTLDGIEKDDALTIATPYNDGFIVGTANGYFACVNSNLQRISNWNHTNGSYEVPLKQMAVSEERNGLFTANRGGCSGVGCKRIHIDNGQLDSFVFPEMGNQKSSTSVGVSESGDVVAYGFGDGKIVVFGIQGMTCMGSFREIPESVVSLAFLDDNTIVAIGKSGTIYRIEGYGLNPLLTEAANQDNWKILNGLAKQKLNRINCPDASTARG